MIQFIKYYIRIGALFERQYQENEGDVVHRSNCPLQAGIFRLFLL